MKLGNTAWLRFQPLQRSPSLSSSVHLRKHISCVFRVYPSSISSRLRSSQQVPWTHRVPKMATPQAITAVIRASKPEFKSTADKAAFAVHAILSVNGFSLRKVGEGVDEAAAQGPSALPAEEVDPTGWNRDAGGDGGTYSFLYVPESAAAQRQQQQQPPLLLVKCLRLVAEASPGPAPVEGSAAGAAAGGSAPAQSGGVLLVSLTDVASGGPPASLELQLDRYVPSLAPGASGYEHLDELIRRVEGALAEALEGQQQASKGKTGVAATTTTTPGAAAGAAAKGSTGDSPQKRDREAAAVSAAEEAEAEERRRRHDPLRDDRYYGQGLPTRGSHGWGPVAVGDEDLMPGGLPPPPGLGGLGGPFGPGGGVPLGPRGMGGGMHVGPQNPIFADRLRHPRGGPGYPPGLGPGGPGGGLGGGGGGVPGMRWDPINPEGLQGWSPDDYTREGRMQRGEGFNDIGRPPPGRGTDWDDMFG
ncbi:hypothetical protein PLESTB_000630700 [Pleodorina starrii]|uniref:Proteasome inhibitor PI31 subunit n=1 Tax=Pleodorina starrii TaxID=330485 RepID=A0A9W6F130_9CHLO|nr:hypothetical protein PLESTB_000630700 [Pleodorina starrii]GLC69699.1 hypothetical protein PLESTF_000867800 [Pleodorina starrii]